MTPSDENKMPELFDTWGHKFGMAYTNSDGRVLYVENFSHSLGFVVFYLGADGNFDERERFPRSRKLRRAPEYDLIPAKSHTELSEIAGEMDNAFDRLEAQCGISFSSHQEVPAFKAVTEIRARYREFMKGK